MSESTPDIAPEQPTIEPAFDVQPIEPAAHEVVETAAEGEAPAEPETEPAPEPALDLPIVSDDKPAAPVVNNNPPPPGPIVAPVGHILAQVINVSTKTARRKPFVWVVTYATEAGVEFTREYDDLNTKEVKAGAKVFVPEVA